MSLLFPFSQPPAAGGKAPVSALLARFKSSLALAFWITLVAEVLSITPIIFMWNVFDRAVSTRSDVTLVSLLVIVLIAYGFWSGLEWVRGRLMARLALRIDWDISAQVFDTAFRRYVARKDVNVHQVLEDVVRLRSFLTGQQILALMSAPFCVVFILVGWAFHPYLAIFIVVATILSLIAAFTTSRITSQSIREANNASAEASRLASQSIAKAGTALALGMHPTIRKRWFEKHQRYLGLEVNAKESAGIVGGFAAFMGHALPSLQLALGAFLAIEGLITGGMVIAASFLLTRAINPLKSVIAGWPAIQSARQSLDRLNAMVAEDEEQSEKMALPPPSGKLDVQNLTIEAGDSRTILSDLSFSLEPGEVMGVIGPTASGKTSLTRALVGLWPPTSGHVRLDGADVAPWIRADLGQYIGYAPVEIDLFEGTVAENIARLGVVDSEQVVAAAQAVGIHDTILSFPKGYDTRIGEVGHVLTGGQRQRIVIARAIYGDPPYVVMDEPNASLDEEGEQALVRLLRHLKQKKTTVVFTTHRIMLLAGADKLMVLRNGKIRMYGPTVSVVQELKQKSEERATSRQVVPAARVSTGGAS